ncbi:MAG: TerC/Alx family metal homeostasis membrane protein [Terriglobia bacterium]
MNTFESLALFNLFVLAVLALDLGFFHRKAHAVSRREAALWSAFWVAVSVGFAFLVYFWQGHGRALEFLTAYILENSLALDNLAVFALLFATMAIPARFQHKVLFWGVLWALVMRGFFILSGAALIARFGWILYILAGFLLVTGALLLLRREILSAPSRAVRVARKLFPVTEEYQGASFFVWRNRKLLATPLLVALIMIELSDLLLAADSIPAVFTVTRDPLIAYSGTILAVLGLRSLYFLLAGTLTKIRYLRTGLSAVLIFLGAKMCFAHFYKMPVEYSLLAIVAILGVTVIASRRSKRPPTAHAEPEPERMTVGMR